MQRYVRRDHVDLSSLGGPADATVLDGEIQEVTPQRQLVWSWNSADHIGIAETEFPLSAIRTQIDGQEAYDLVHLNSLQRDGDGILVSARHVNAVYRIRRADGGVDWKLGGSGAPRASTSAPGRSAPPTSAASTRRAGFPTGRSRCTTTARARGARRVRCASPWIRSPARPP